MKKLLSKSKHIAVRTCRVCMKAFSKAELMRLVRTSVGSTGEAGVVLDVSQALPGRGVYFCSGCKEKAKSPKLAKAFSYWLKSPVSGEVFKDL